MKNIDVTTWFAIGFLTCLAVAPPPVFAQGESSSGRTVGSSTAPITLEVFSDFQCPYCKTLEEETLRQIREVYARTGKVRMLHHDFPLSMHAHAREAARYARAADRVGKFAEVAEALFRQQEAWAASGDIEATVDAVLTPDEADRVRGLARDPMIDAALMQDIELGQRLQVDSTPTMIIRHGGQDYRVAGAVSYAILSKFLDQLLAQ